MRERRSRPPQFRAQPSQLGMFVAPLVFGPVSTRCPKASKATKSIGRAAMSVAIREIPLPAAVFGPLFTQEKEAAT